MIDEIVYLGCGITSHIDTIMKHIKENPNEIIGVGRVHDGGDSYSFIALFKDKCTIGKKSVVMEEWGTNDGISGEGGRGYIRMNKFLEDNEIEVEDLELTRDDAKKIGYINTRSMISYIKDWEDRKKIWKKYITELNYSIGE